MWRSFPRRSRLVLMGIAVLMVVMVVAGLLSIVRERRGSAIVIDFTESIDSRVVYPMDRRTVIVNMPERVDLRFPDGHVYANDHAWEVWVDRTGLGNTDLIEEVSVNTQYERLDDVYGRANQFRAEWQFRPDPVFEDWYTERKRSGPGDWSLDKAGRSRTIVGIEHDGKRLSVGFEIRGTSHSETPYQLIEEFHWLDPRADDGDR